MGLVSKKKKKEKKRQKEKKHQYKPFGSSNVASVCLSCELWSAGPPLLNLSPSIVFDLENNDQMTYSLEHTVWNVDVPVRYAMSVMSYSFKPVDISQLFFSAVRVLYRVLGTLGR